MCGIYSRVFIRKNYKTTRNKNECKENERNSDRKEWKVPVQHTREEIEQISTFKYLGHESEIYFPLDR